MKKIMLILMLVFVSSISYAENWTYVGVDNEGTSYYVNSSSIKVNESYGGNSVTNISVEVKLDNKNNSESYIISRILFYETGWEELKSLYVYHRGTGKVIQREDYIDGPKEQMDPNSIDYKISKNLFAQYKERVKKEKEEMKKKANEYKHPKPTFIGEFVAGLFFSIIGFLFYLYKRKNSK